MRSTLKLFLALLVVNLITITTVEGQWSFSGVNIFNSTSSGSLNTSGKVGIGTLTPKHALDVNGRIHISNGVIQRGGNPIINTSDLGLYSLDNGMYMRFVTNNAPFRFFSDGATNPIGSSEIFTIEPNGNVGIGTSSPKDKIQIGNGAYKLVAGSAYGSSLGWGTGYIGFNAARQNAMWSTESDGAHNGASIIYSDIFGNMFFSTIPTISSANQNNIPDATIINNTVLFIGANGKVGIGTKEPGSFKLAVDGKIGAREVLVTLSSPWPDYVFSSNYNKMSLLTLESYILENNHLPGIPSDKEIKANGGVDLGVMQIKQLEKVEEIFLHLIDLNNKLLILTSENKKLNKELLILKSKLESK